MRRRRDVRRADAIPAIRTQKESVEPDTAPPASRANQRSTAPDFNLERLASKTAPLPPVEADTGNSGSLFDIHIQ
jgi:hypothetical protein